MRRLSLVFGAVLVIGCAAVVVVVSVVLAMRYERVAADLDASAAELPRGVRSVLSPSAGTLDHAQVTLVRMTGRSASGGALLVRTDPAQESTAYLGVPPSASVAGVPIRGQAVPELIRRLYYDVDIPVAHVALVDLASIGRLVDALGGIEVHNPRPFHVWMSSSLSWRVPQGIVHLDGRHTVVYLAQGDPHTHRHDAAQERVLTAIVGHALNAGGISQLEHTAAAVSASAATDLTPGDVIGLVWARVETRHLVECTAPQRQPLETTMAHQIIRSFLSQTAPAAGCQTRKTSPPTFLPPKSAVALVASYGRWAFVATAILAALLMAGLVVLLSRLKPAATPAAAASTAHATPTLAMTVPPSTSRWDWRCGLARLRRVQAKRLAQIDSAARTILHQARHVGPTWDWRRGLARLRRFEAKRLAPIGSARTILHKAQSWPGLISHNQRRIRRFLYWHPDLIWAFICVATSFALAILITAA